MSRVLALALAAVASCAAAARAEERTLKMAIVAPDGTMWVREVRGALGEIAALTGGALRVKLYPGAVAGEEREVAERIVKGQLDGTISAGVLCEQVSPTLRALRIPGLFDNAEEAAQVTARLRATEEAEAQAAGYQLLGVGTMGDDMLFSKSPVRSLADFRRLRFWRWQGDDVGIAVARAIGVNVVPTGVLEAAHAYEAGRLDGFMAIPTAALAFQWSAHARYLSLLRVGHLNGCFLLSTRSFDKLPRDQQQAVRAAVAKLAGRIEQVSRRDDEQLVNGLFERQGLTPVPASPAFRAEFVAAAREARGHLPESIMPHAVVERVLKTLAEYRAEIASARRK
jgi:TRAP-type C4-dicarboxylate transport system substrate-binding protein